MELPPDFIHDPPKGLTLTKLRNSDATFYLFGVAIILNSLTTAVLLQKLFGDSTTLRNDAITRLSTPVSKEIR